MKELIIQFFPGGQNTPVAFYVKMKMQRKRLKDMSPEAKQALLQNIDEAMQRLAVWKNEVITHY